MIARILGEGQWELEESALDELNTHDGALEKALTDGSEPDFRGALAGLLAVVRVRGRRLPDEYLGHSDIALPAADASPEEVRAMLGDDGLVPG